MYLETCMRHCRRSHQMYNHTDSHHPVYYRPASSHAPRCHSRKDVFLPKVSNSFSCKFCLAFKLLAFILTLTINVILYCHKGNVLTVTQDALFIIKAVVTTISLSLSLSPGSLCYLPRCSAHRATPVRPQVGG